MALNMHETPLTIKITTVGTAFGASTGGQYGLHQQLLDDDGITHDAAHVWTHGLQTAQHWTDNTTSVGAALGCLR
jgi:hypothetical protein